MQIIIGIVIGLAVGVVVIVNVLLDGNKKLSEMEETIMLLKAEKRG